MSVAQTLTPLSMRSAEDGLINTMQRVAAGDADAFSQLYDELAPLVFGVTVRVLRDRSIAEEVSQEVFVELWRTANRYDQSRGSVRAWAATLAHRRAIDRVRSEDAAKRRDTLDLTESTFAAEALDPVAAEVESSFDRYRVHQALAGLAPQQREAIELAYVGGFTYREVAERIGVPEGTVKTRIRDGMMRLRAELGVDHE